MQGLHFSDQRGKSYYYNTITGFLSDDSRSILGELTRRSFSPSEEQNTAWIEQIGSLQSKLRDCGASGNIIFEYDIVRLGKRIDVVLLIRHMVFSLEFKNGAKKYHARDAEQAEDYALDIKNFHKESEDLYVCPILIATEAEDRKNTIAAYDDKQVALQYANKTSMMKCIEEVYNTYGSDEEIDFASWYNSPYCPTPTIIEAAVEAYISHTVAEIAHSEAGQEDISKCEKCLSEIIDHARRDRRKCICFITGVPGAGKTLVGLDIAAKTLSDKDKAVYISGNGPLVKVLRKALKENKKQRSASKPDKQEEREIDQAVKTFIQDAYAFRKEYLGRPDNVPPENVIIFDEAQRCWSREKLKAFVQKKMGIKDFSMSEPECFIQIMNRREDWAVVICLVGLGQDIYDGEVGVNEWLRTAIEEFPQWELFYSDKIFTQLEERGIDREMMTNCERAHSRDALHLSTSIRSFRSEHQSRFTDCLLSGDTAEAKRLYDELIEEYPLYLTRDLKKAKEWVRSKVRGSQRCGLIACSSAQRLKPEGIFVPTDIDVENWFLAPKEDLRSSNALEIVASEFKVQGLELDYCIVAWDADLRRAKDGWEYYNFRGTKWNRRKKEEQKRYLLNAYRVLLTRARQGFIIFVPEGVDADIDSTRDHRYYDAIFSYLHEDCGIRVL